MSSNNAPLDWKDIKNSAAKFSIRFKDAKKEESYKQTFWNEFFQMFGIDAIEVGMYEQFVKKFDNHTGEIDYFWPGKLIIEHKSAGKDLDAAFNQAMDYILGIKDRKLWPRYIIVSDFKRIRLIDIVDHHDDTILLSDLVNHIEKFGFLAGYNNKRIEGQHPVNVKAAEVMGKLYDLLKESNYPKEDLDTLLIRLVFCMFAEDADIFEKNIFSVYLAFHTNEDGAGMAGALTEIFSVLDTPLENRQKTMTDELKNFPYVNGGLFSKQIPAPAFDREMRDILFEASRLDWKFISPAIFDSLFQCIMDPSKRRELGAHYTSEENILKLINPLFMENLRHEFQIAKGNKKALRQLWDKMSNIRILDPACGCGNFLIISYREMRLLEMDLLKELYGNQMMLDESHLYVDHYYGIEIGEFASMVANLSIILMDHLMNLEMRNRFGQSRDIIPLKEKANIVCANSLTLNWSDLVDSGSLTYIVGNPPFNGARTMTKEQKEEIKQVFDDMKNVGDLDYVTAWYKKACDYIQNNNIKVAFVSTNSIVQGEQAVILWEYLFEKYEICIDFAYQTFVWNNEAKANAKVHCIIVGFSPNNNSMKMLFDSNCNVIKTKNINNYLLPAPTIFVHKSSKPVSPGIPRMIMCSMPLDDGNLTFDQSEYDDFISKDPESKQFFRIYMMGYEFLNSVPRYCLWLKGIDLTDLKKHPLIMDRIEKVRTFRSKSTRENTLKASLTPYLFGEDRQPDSKYIAVPKVSSERRHYVPIGFMDADIIAGDKIFIIPGANLYHFGVLSSSMHDSWMRTVAGRLKSDYSYSNTIVYNCFVWPSDRNAYKSEIEMAAEQILAIRDKYSDKSLSDLYDPLLMPPELLKAHQGLDKYVDLAYSGRGFKSDEARVSFLFDMYNSIKNDEV